MGIVAELQASGDTSRIRQYVKSIKSLISSDVYDTTQMGHYVKWLLCMSCVNIENTTLQIVTYRRPHHILAYAYLVDTPVCDVADGIVKYSAHTAVQSFVLFHIVTYILSNTSLKFHFLRFGRFHIVTYNKYVGM